MKKTLIFFLVSCFVCVSISADMICLTEYEQIQRSVPKTGTVKAIVIYVCGKNVPTTLPTWHSDICGISIPLSIPNYFESMSFGQHHLRMTPFGKTTNSCFFVDMTWSNSVELISLTFWNAALDTVDKYINFSLFDNDGSDGIPNSGDDDGEVDFLFFVLANHFDGNGRGGGYDYITSDNKYGGGKIKIDRKKCTMNSVISREGADKTIAHEYGHALGLPDLDHDGPDPEDQFDHYGTGDFDLMVNSTGFEDRQGCINPYHRKSGQLGWVSPISIPDNINYLDTTIQDFQTSHELYKLSNNNNYQYFLVTNHQKESIWEHRWPGTGLLIWHINEAGSLKFSINKKIDIESAHGLYSWNGLIRGNPNPENGLDSLDKKGVYPPDNRHNGGATCFFNPDLNYTSFDKFTNPSSKFHNEESIHLQNVDSHIAVKNIQFGPGNPGENRDVLAKLCTNYWAGSIYSSTTWFLSKKKYYIGGDISSYSNLTIEPNVEVIFLDWDDLHAGNNPNKSELFIHHPNIGSNVTFSGAEGSSISFNSAVTFNSGTNITFGDNLIVTFNQNFTMNDGANISFGNNTIVNFQETTTLNTGSSCTFGENSEVNFHDDVHLHGTFIFGEYSTITYYNFGYFYRTSHCTYMPHSIIYYIGGSNHGGDGEFCSSSRSSFQGRTTFNSSASYNFNTSSIATFTTESIIDSAATVNFDHASLFVNDSLLVFGKFWADNCTIDFGNDTTKAQGIVFEGGGASLSRITDSIVRDCMDGITIINSSPLIKTSEFFNMEKRGFNIIGIDAEPEIRECYIHLTGTYPLQMLSEADPTLVDNRFYGIGKTGARIWGADGTFSRNEFRSNNESGVFVFSSSAQPQFYSFADSGGNMFDMSNIATQAVFIGGGNPMFGDYPNTAGNNIFKNRGSRYYLYNDTPGNIVAELSWWANGTGTGSYYNADGGNVDFSPKLTTEPPAGPLLLKAAASPFNTGFEKYRQKDYAGAMQDLKQMLQQDKTSVKADQAVFRLGKAARKIGRLGELESFLGDLKKEKDPQIQYHSRNWLCYLYASRNDMKKAERLLDEVPKGSSYERTLLLDICSYYASLKDMKNANRIADMLRERHNNDVLAMELEAALEGWVDFKQVKGQTRARRSASKSIPVPDVTVEMEMETAAPADTVAFKAGIYPNPFNSSTTINFNVEQSGPVQIAIYDLLGRRVQTLVDDRRATGSYRAVWNGCDNTGRSVASGIYFVHMQVGGKEQSIKISYVK